MIERLFINGNEAEITKQDIPILQLEKIFENCNLHYCDNNEWVLLEDREFETIIIKNGMQFFGDVYLLKINKSLKIIDDDYDMTFNYISLYGVFDIYTEGNQYQRFYKT